MFSFTSLAMNMVQVMSTQHYYKTWESFSIYLEPCTTNKNTSHFIHFILKNHNNIVYFYLWLFLFFFKWTPPFSHLFCGFGPVQCTLSTCEQCLTKSLGNLQFSWETSETKHLPQNLFQKMRWKSALSTFSLKEVSWRLAFSILFLNHFVKSKF